MYGYIEKYPSPPTSLKYLIDCYIENAKSWSSFI